MMEDEFSLKNTYVESWKCEFAILHDVRLISLGYLGAYLP
jgi:hypothetical protein